MQTSHNLAYKSYQNARWLTFLCVIWKIRTVSVEIGRIGLGRTLFTNFESNVWTHYTKTVFRSSRNKKSSYFSIRCVFYFIANVYITLNNTRNLFASIKFCSESTVVTGVGAVSPASTLDRVILVIRHCMIPLVQ